MTDHIRFGTYVRELTARQTVLSYNLLVPAIEHDEEGKELPYKPPRARLRGIDVYRLVEPYMRVRLLDQVRAVVPLALYLVLFQILVLKQSVADAWLITGGLVAVIFGLMLFMEGLAVGLMPFGRSLGGTLPAKAGLPVVLTVTFLLGIGVTFAEPAIGALKTAGSIVDVKSAPYLYALLTEWAEVLVLVVGASVGLAAVLGTLRFIYGWSLKPMIYLAVGPTLLMTAWLSLDVDLAKTIGLAWDCGAVTTGPVTVPLVLSLGIGIARAAGKGDGGSSLSGFGIVTMASLFPILGVMGLAWFVSTTASPEEIVAAAAQASAQEAAPSWYEVTPGVEVVLGARAILPLVLFLVAVMRLLLRERIRKRGEIAYGITLCVLGMCVFNLGLTYGLSMLGAQSGSMVPGAFTELEAVAGSPLFGAALGVSISVGFAFVLGFGATLAEPALNALGVTVENLTNGAFKKSTLLYAVSLGVGVGIGTGVAKVIYGFPLAWLLVPAYLLALVLTKLSSEEFVNVAWDSAGVTTGPVTVPLVLAMGLGFGDAVGAIEGFGVLSMASIGPILSVLATGLWVQLRVKKRHKRTVRDVAPGASRPETNPARET